MLEAKGVSVALLPDLLPSSAPNVVFGNLAPVLSGRTVAGVSRASSSTADKRLSAARLRRADLAILNCMRL